MQLPSSSFSASARWMLAALLLGSGAARAQQLELSLEDKSAWFPFVIPALSDDKTMGSAIDLSYLNAQEAGKSGFLRARGEKIVDGRGREVRLFGTNITDYHVMPPKELSPLIARRLSELGINWVRLHYYDWTSAPAGILNADGQTLDATKLDQMDWLIAQLKKHGIYVDINLHVARRYAGQPDDWDAMGKGLDRIYAPFIESQKRFARDLLTHVNPYTKTPYTREPAVANVEINNENSLAQPQFWTRLKRLPETIQAPIRSQWNQWLRARYTSTRRLRATWDGGVPPEGKELLLDVEAPKTDALSVEAGSGAEAALEVMRDENNAPFWRWSADKAGAQSWNLQLHQTNVPVVDGQAVRLRFRARADRARTVQVRLMLQQEPWSDVARAPNLELSPQWQQFDFSLSVRNASKAPVRLTFDAQNQTGTVDLAALSLRPGGKPGVPPGTNLEKGTVPLLDTSDNPRAVRDFTLFIGERDRAYTQQMTRFLKRDLGVRSLVWDTQVNYGGAQGLLRENRWSDAIDIHAYPAHPNGTRDGEASLWSVRQISMLGEAMNGLVDMAQWRVAGKPFVVSEFDLNPPNDHAGEAFPLLALMASYQGWSGFGDYAWFNFQPNNWNPNGLHSPFATSGHAGQMAFMPMAALMFRQGLVQAARQRRTLQISEAQLRDGDANSSALNDIWRAQKVPSVQAWQSALAVQVRSGQAPRVIGPAVPASAPDGRAQFNSDSGQIHLDRTQKERETLIVNAPAVRMAFGFTGGRTFEVGDVRFEVARGTRNDYANIALVALDGRPISQSKTMLLTTVARTENKEQRFNADRSSTGRDFGAGPVLAEPVALTLSLPGGNWNLQALDANGRPVASTEAALTGARFEIGAGQKTLWYLLRR